MQFQIAPNYDVQKHPWYSPHLVLRAMSRLTKQCGSNVESKREFKLAREMFDGAIALLGAYEIDKDNLYYMQPNLQSDSPDFVAAKLTESKVSPVLLELVNIEVVTMNDYAGTDDPVEFLKQTKLSSKKSYDSKTLILCEINKKISIDRQKISKDLQAINPKSTIYFLGHLQNTSNTWTIFSAFPRLTKFIIFKPSDTARKYQLHDVVNLTRRLTNEIVYEKGKEEKTTIFDIFNIKESEIERYKIT